MSPATNSDVSPEDSPDISPDDATTSEELECELSAELETPAEDSDERLPDEPDDKTPDEPGSASEEPGTNSEEQELSSMTTSSGGFALLPSSPQETRNARETTANILFIFSPCSIPPLKTKGSHFNIDYIKGKTNMFLLKLIVVRFFRGP